MHPRPDPPTPTAAPSPNCHRGYSIAHPRQQLHVPTHLHSNPTIIEGALNRTLNSRWPAPSHPAESNRHRRCTGIHPQPDSPPLLPSLHHPTATEGAALRTLDSNCTTQPTRTAAQPTPRVHNTAPSTPIRAPDTKSSNSKPPRGHTKTHPRPRTPRPYRHLNRTTTNEGARKCTLDRD